MSGNPKTSKWYATPRDKRRRKKVEVTLSDEARAWLEHVATVEGMTRSAVVEMLLQAHKEG